MSIAILNKSILQISRENIKELINGLITQDIGKLSINSPIYALFLNNKGRVLFSTIIYMLNENSVAIEIEEEFLMELAKHIHKYDITGKAEFNQKESFIAISNEQKEGFYQDPRNTELPYRGIIDNKVESNSKLLEDYENRRLKLEIPENNDFIREKSLANDLNIEKLNGISFSKGCYLGQEITSKTKHIKPTKNMLICLDNIKFNVNSLNNEIFDESNTVVGKTFSYNKQFVLCIIKRNSDLKTLKIK